MICKHKSIKLNGSKYYYVSLTIQHQTFVYIQLNDQTFLFQTIQFSINHLFALSLNMKILFDPIRCHSSRSEWTWEQWQWRDCLVSYPGHLFVLHLCREVVDVFYSPRRLDWMNEMSILLHSQIWICEIDIFIPVRKTFIMSVRHIFR